jgi:hypothetical protein
VTSVSRRGRESVDPGNLRSVMSTDCQYPCGKLLVDLWFTDQRHSKSSVSE